MIVLVVLLFSSCSCAFDLLIRYCELLQPVIWTIIETVFLPYANTRLGKGFPLPIIRGFTLQNAEIICSNAGVTVCSDVTFAESYDLMQSLIYSNKWTHKIL